MKNMKNFAKRWLNLSLGMSMILLAGCATAGYHATASSAIYQPNFIYLQKNVPIQTMRGIYTPEFNEAFVSERVYNELEERYMQISLELAKYKRLENKK